MNFVWIQFLSFILSLTLIEAQAATADQCRIFFSPNTFNCRLGLKEYSELLEPFSDTDIQGIGQAIRKSMNNPDNANDMLETLQDGIEYKALGLQDLFLDLKLIPPNTKHPHLHWLKSSLIVWSLKRPHPVPHPHFIAIGRSYDDLTGRYGLRQEWEIRADRYFYFEDTQYSSWNRWITEHLEEHAKGARDFELVAIKIMKDLKKYEIWNDIPQETEDKIIETWTAILQKEMGD